MYYLVHAFSTTITYSKKNILQKVVIILIRTDLEVELMKELVQWLIGSIVFISSTDGSMLINFLFTGGLFIDFMIYWFYNYFYN